MSNNETSNRAGSIRVDFKDVSDVDPRNPVPSNATVQKRMASTPVSYTLHYDPVAGVTVRIPELPG